VSGQLRRISLKPGAEVEQGVTVVAVIDPLPSSPLDNRNRALAEARLSSSRIILEKSRTSHELARNELRRIEQMFAAKTISPQELDAAQMRETTAARDVAAAEGALSQVEAELTVGGLSGGQDFQPAAVGREGDASTNVLPIEVKANASGRVLHVFQESSRAVMQGTPLLEIGDPADLEVIVEMLSRDGAAIAPGAPVVLEQWGGPAPLEGRVRLVEPAAFTKYSALGVEEQRVNVVVDITSPREQWRSLGDNFRVEARVITWESAAVLKLPVSGIFRQGNDWAAYVVRNGLATLVSLKAGRTNGGEIQIVEGLQEGDEVILYPGDRIHDGQRVKSTRI
jgi:HlyD family secretion protein